MATKKKMLQAAAGSAAGGGFTAIEDVFSTYLYTGNGSTQTITNGIDLAGEGGLVWTKSRSGAYSHGLYDTERGATKEIKSDATTAESTDNGVTAFNSDGYTVGARFTTNNNADTYASWTFRKAPRFFDVVTYTGDGTNNRSIAHDLGVSPGTIITKATNVARSWLTWHRSLAVDNYLTLNTTNAVSSFSNTFGAPSDSDFIVGSGGTNISGETYVAYLFAHDPLGPSGDGSDGLIACGSYTGTGAAGLEVDLGWEPQWLLVKRTDSADNWVIADNMRGIYGQNSPEINHPYLQANTSGAELASSWFKLNADGFQLQSTGGRVNASGGTYIYIAIRRGPMRAPTSGTEVFAPAVFTDVDKLTTAGFPVDAAIEFDNISVAYNQYFSSRLTASKALSTSNDAGENTETQKWDSMTQVQLSNQGNNHKRLYYMFRRAAGFLDVVTWVGSGTVSKPVPHNLGVAPEMIWIKRRDATEDWFVPFYGVSGISNGHGGKLNKTDSFGSMTASTTPPTSDTLYVGGSFGLAGNTSGGQYIAYLFATVAGVSKFGTYTGNGSSQTINCGFTTGARFILIKRTDSTGPWHVFDTARGIVAGNDPRLKLDNTDAETTTQDFIDPDSSGFSVTSSTITNASGGNYIFYAIA